MKLEAIIFDMDGVLIDSEPSWGKAMNTCFGEVGLHLSQDELKQTTGLRLNEVIDYWILKKDLKNINVEELIHKTYNLVFEITIAHGGLIDGVMELLENLKLKKIPIGLASSSSIQLITNFIEFYKLQKYFDIILSADNYKYGKPHPEVFLECAQKMGVKNMTNCVVIEDSINGIVAAKAARMKVVALPDFHKKEKPQFCLADKIVVSLKELINFDWEKFIQN